MRMVPAVLVGLLRIGSVRDSVVGAQDLPKPLLVVKWQGGSPTLENSIANWAGRLGLQVQLETVVSSREKLTKEMRTNPGASIEHRYLMQLLILNKSRAVGGNLFAKEAKKHMKEATYGPGTFIAYGTGPQSSAAAAELMARVPEETVDDVLRKVLSEFTGPLEKDMKRKR